MKILVLSDSHRTIGHMERAVLAQRPDYLIHLGDHTADADALARLFPDIPLVSVRGNCDFDPAVPEQRLGEWGGVRILMTHGHRYGVKSGLLRLRLAAQEAQAQIALFGHTHQALCQGGPGLWLFNPGSCGGFRPTCGLIEITGGVPDFHILNLNEGADSL